MLAVSNKEQSGPVRIWQSDTLLDERAPPIIRTCAPEPASNIGRDYCKFLRHREGKAFLIPEAILAERDHTEHSTDAMRGAFAINQGKFI